MPSRIHALSNEDALRALRSSFEGLDEADAARRRAEFGLNKIGRVARSHPLVRLARQFTHFFALILWVAAVLALGLALTQPGSGMGTLAGAILGVIVINGVFSFWQEDRAARALESLERLLPAEIVVHRPGGLARLSTLELVPGDVFVIEGGQRVPADARVLEASDLRVNNATLTGESVPAWRDARPCDEDDPARATNMLLAGTVVVSGRGRGLVTATGDNTAFAHIARLTQGIADQPSPLQADVSRLSRIIAVLAVVIGSVFFVMGLALGQPLVGSLVFAIGIIVANVPEGLLPTMTLALAMAAQRMARRHVIVRHLPAVEALGATTVICTDKTGTLTENRMRVHSIHVDSQVLEARTAETLRKAAEREPRFFEIALYCENIQETGGPAHHELLGDPTEIALMEMARTALGAAPARERLREIPFDPDRRRLSVMCRDADREILYCKGALEALLPLCSHVRAGGRTVILDEERRRTITRVENDLATSGLRVLALAWRYLPAEARGDEESELVLAGLAALEDPPRAEVPEAIRRCREAHIRVIMMTGDHPRTAAAIALQIGLVATPGCRVITGDELEHMKDATLQLALGEEVIFARTRSDQKSRIVEVLRRRNEVVAMTGDGINDAPALRAADIGIAMGQSGTDVARETADIVLADDNFATIVNGIEEGRAVYANIRKFLTYILASNVPEVVPYLAFVLLPIPLPLTVIQILAVDLGTDMLPAIALGAERPEPHQMQAPPRPRGERLLARGVLLRAYGFLGAMEAAASMAAWYLALRLGGWRFGEPLAVSDPLYARATAACLLAIIAMQVVNVFLCRSDRESALAGRPLANRLLLAGVAVEIGLIAAILYTDAGQRIFGTAPVPTQVIALLIPCALAMFGLEELRKWVARGLNHRSRSRL